ncbi:Pre-mRNA-splicing ATP-dependent RNA helicase prp-28 [Lasiosphaeria miniovina]|uniref:RNA helicase n=1 Tax=Lasiosphaeria miniovina TaxID=1954250 RepID=A0AA40BGW6_9PEZI|nr:Pre-mRNA-splicing ATP-dependent RNA helicase prp-28 [Lasiosphaeria miniovina]KAK0734022.1 Pre-mRNA-splicing ATP-dependent RNA helicase prp-28 [Lasiosphaeria miniovina]
MSDKITTRREPPDLAALLRKRKAEEELAAKPRFISKKERERLEAEKQAKEEEDRKLKEESRPRDNQANGNQTVDGMHRSRQLSRQSIPTGPKAMRNGANNEDVLKSSNGGGNRQNGRRGPSNNEDDERKSKMERNDEAELRARYMGPVVNQSTFSAKKKRRRTAANKFNFEWDADDDTSRPFDPIYAERVEPLIRLGGYEMTDELARRKADAIRRGDPVTGEQRAREYMDQHERAKKQGERKNLGKHWSEKSLDDMKERDWRIFKENFGISTKGGSIPNPMRSWEESKISQRLLRVVADVGYEEPSPIQRAAIPIALQARDLIGVAVTGSGKTAAFLLPLLEYITELPALSEYNKNDGPYALILAPTRELVQQIESEARKFATPLGFTVVSIVGGHSLEEQAFALRNGAEIIVATPGRLVDCLERRLLVFTQCCYVIMDEADRMIDQGFEEPLTKILDALPVTNEKPDTDDAENPQLMSRYLGGKDRYRQTMMYTATMPPLVERIAKKYLRRPAIVTIGNAGEAVDTVEQRVEFVTGEDKRKKRLNEILHSGQFKPPIIVFVNIKRNCDMIARDIKGMGFSAVTLHGSKTQEQREAALLSLRNGQIDILVATDLAGRGIDVPDVSLVVNFNMAMSIESYTHRIGRTGRAGKSGVAITFLGPEDNDVLYDLRQIISKSSISKVPEELRRHEAAQSKPQRGQKKLEDSGGFGGKGGNWQ